MWSFVPPFGETTPYYFLSYIKCISQSLHMCLLLLFIIEVLAVPQTTQARPKLTPTIVDNPQIDALSSPVSIQVQELELWRERSFCKLAVKCFNKDVASGYTRTTKRITTLRQPSFLKKDTKARMHSMI